MKKKSARKVSHSTKSISRSPKKKNFSLKSWLLGGLGLALVVAMVVLGNHQKGLKVLSIPGSLADYINPAKPNINVIATPNKNLAISDSPEAAAYTAAYQVKTTAAAKAAKGEKVDQAKVEKDMETAAKDAAAKSMQLSIQQAPLSSDDQAAALATYKLATGTKFDDLTKDEKSAATQKNINPETVQTTTQIAQQATSTVNSYNLKVTGDGTKSTDYTIDLSSAQPKSGNGRCRTNAGSEVASGSTMIGPAQGDGVNSIYECKSDGTWKQVGTCGTGEAVKDCNVSIKPTYALKSGQANCYQDNLIIGQDQKIDNQEGGKSQCKNGNLVPLKKSANGQYLTDQEIADLKNNCERDGGKYGTWDPNQLICGAGSNEKKIAADAAQYEKNQQDLQTKKSACLTRGGRYNEATGACDPVVANSTSKVVNPNGTLTGGQITTKATDCKYGATVMSGGSNGATFRCNDSTGKVPTTVEECSAQGTVVVCKVYDLKGNYVSEYRKTAQTIPNEVHANGIYDNGQETTNESECIYGGVVMRAGSNGAVFRCKNSDGKLPATTNSLPQSGTAFDSSSSQTNITGNSRRVSNSSECNSNETFEITSSGPICRLNSQTSSSTQTNTASNDNQTIITDALCGGLINSDSSLGKYCQQIAAATVKTETTIGSGGVGGASGATSFWVVNKLSNNPEKIIPLVIKSGACGTAGSSGIFNVDNDACNLALDKLNLPTLVGSTTGSTTIFVAEAAKEVVKAAKDGSLNGKNVAVGAVTGVGCIKLLTSNPSLLPACLSGRVIVGAALGDASATLDLLKNQIDNQSPTTNTTLPVPATRGKGQNPDLVQTNSSQSQGTKACWFDWQCGGGNQECIGGGWFNNGACGGASYPPATQENENTNIQDSNKSKDDTHINNSDYGAHAIADTVNPQVVVDKTNQAAEDSLKAITNPTPWQQIGNTLNNAWEAITGLFKPATPNPTSDKSSQPNTNSALPTLPNNAKGKKCYIANTGSSEDCSKCPPVEGSNYNYGTDPARPSFVYCLK